MRVIRFFCAILAVIVFSATDTIPVHADTFYSLQNTNTPPLPFLPFDVPIYEMSSGVFAFDDLSIDYVQLRSETSPPNPEEGGGTNENSSTLLAYNYSTNDVWVELVTATNETVTILLHAPGTAPYDLYRTFLLQGDSITNGDWQWMARGTNNQPFTLTNGACCQAFYILGTTNDTDADGLTDAYELLVTKTSTTNSHSVNALFTDAQMENILVNDRRQDCGNEQNSQFETTCAVLGTNVIVAWVDSNLGVYELGDPNADASSLSNRTPRLVGYAVSRDNGLTFEDMGVPPLGRAGSPTDDDGDAGDPVLAIDSAAEIVYLAGTSPRNQGHKGIPFWRSTNNGVSFENPIIVRDDIMQSDKPWIAVDNAAGIGQRDIYLGCVGKVGTNNPPITGLWLTTSTNYGTDWSLLIAIRQRNVDNVVGIQSLIPLPGPNHTIYAFWFERTEVGGSATNWIKVRHVLGRGETLGNVETVCGLVTTDSINGNLRLRRSNTAATNDTFSVLPFPVPAVNPVKTNHLYVAYADRSTSANDPSDVFFVCSTNGGTHWTAPFRVNADTTTNDQWMPVLIVKPDGTQLFMSWYDRRNDTNNSLIDVYGCFGVIATNGAISFGSNFKISAVNFSPVFAGTLLENTNIGFYDPVYPPGGVNLNWWYPEWPLLNFLGEPQLTQDAYKSHVGEYNGGWASENSVYISWTDYRLESVCTRFPRNQSDVRFIRLTWPN
ncbi:MAG: hypothetical protein ABJC04_03395 [Verrucomicrobiota bacterium]